MTTLFIILSIFCIYTYLIYPFAIAVLARGRPLPEVENDQAIAWPSVSIVVAVHNEKQHIANKLKNLRELEYFKEVEIVIVSDGSTDGTNEYLQKQSDISFFNYPASQGKPTALNIGVENAHGDIIVFMDARQTVSLDCLKELVKYFTFENVGAVSGELVMRNTQSGEAENIGLYWRYEKWIRSNESRFFSTAGATGALYAIRKSSFVQLPASILLDDFEIPLNSLKHGQRTLFVPRAIAYDIPSNTSNDEFKRKLRTLTGNYQSFFRNPWLFHPFANKIFFQFISHKVFRLLVPYAMLVALISSGFSDSKFVGFLFVAQLVFYLVGLLAFSFSSFSEIKIFNFIKVFLQLNFAAVLGLYYFVFRNSKVKWKSA